MNEAMRKQTISNGFQKDSKEKHFYLQTDSKSNRLKRHNCSAMHAD